MATIRAKEPALRYGRQYFREISGNGLDFGRPTAGKCTLAFSCVLDSDEIVVAFNLDTVARNDFILIDPAFSADGQAMTNLLGGRKLTVKECKPGLFAIRVPLEAREMAILKRG